MSRNIFLLICFFLSGSAVFAQSAQSQAPVFFDLNSGLSIANSSFTNTWEPRPVIHLNIRFPYYGGQLEGGIRYIRFHGMAPTDTDSDYNSFFIHVGYSYPFHLTDRYTLGPTLRFGNNLMLFDQKETYTSGSFYYETDPSEIEFAYELALRNQFQISDHWFLNATILYNRTLTHYPLPLTMLSAGITYSFGEPQWLKALLQ